MTPCFCCHGPHHPPPPAANTDAAPAILPQRSSLFGGETRRTAKREGGPAAQSPDDIYKSPIKNDYVRKFPPDSLHQQKLFPHDFVTKTVADAQYEVLTQEYQLGNALLRFFCALRECQSLEAARERMFETGEIDPRFWPDGEADMRADLAHEAYLERCANMGRDSEAIRDLCRRLAGSGWKAVTRARHSNGGLVVTIRHAPEDVTVAAAPETTGEPVGKRVRELVEQFKRRWDNPEGAAVLCSAKRKPELAMSDPVRQGMAERLRFMAEYTLCPDPAAKPPYPKFKDFEPDDRIDGPDPP